MVIIKGKSKSQSGTQREMFTMANVNQVVNFIINWAQDKGEPITNMWLQKLLYFSQGQQLARTGNRLFSDRIEAWQWGPVVPGVYHMYKKYGDNPIPKATTFQPHQLTADECDLVYDVLRKYGIYTASELMRQSHDTDPWKNAYTGEKHKEISNSDMQAFFSMPLNKVSSFDDVLACADIPVYDTRNTDGYLMLPADDAARECEDAV